ncbi:MAG: ATP-dependent metallopeptidase FtsH/Yme1/Tma family protein [Balneolaceae bacterium]|nr:ATP-dependent metallopeptidase FtsH/Yme1/Tma family protein [Balneolaceae bacterium]
MSDSNHFPNRKPDSGYSKKGGRSSSRFPIWIYVVLFVALLAVQFWFISPENGDRIKYSTFLEYVEQGYISQITIRNGTDVTGQYSSKAVEEGIVTPPSPEDNQWSLGGGAEENTFSTTMLEGDEIRPLLDEHEVIYDVRIEESWFNGILIWLIPIGLAIAFWIYIFRRMNPGQQVLNIGKNKASLYDKQADNKVSFKDVAGLQEAKAEVEEVVEFLQKPQEIHQAGRNPSQGGAAGGSAGNRQDPAGQGYGRGGRRSFLQPQRLRFCGDVRRRGRGPRA